MLIDKLDNLIGYAEPQGLFCFYAYSPDGKDLKQGVTGLEHASPGSFALLSLLSSRGEPDLDEADEAYVLQKISLMKRGKLPDKNHLTDIISTMVDKIVPGTTESVVIACEIPHGKNSYRAIGNVAIRPNAAGSVIHVMAELFEMAQDEGKGGYSAVREVIKSLTA